MDFLNMNKKIEDKNSYFIELQNHIFGFNSSLDCGHSCFQWKGLFAHTIYTQFSQIETNTKKNCCKWMCFIEKWCWI
jgi:hypothetical protein